MMFTPLRLFAIDIKEMFRSTPAVLILYVILNIAVSWRLDITGWVQALLYLASTLLCVRLAFSTPLITGQLRIYSWRNLGIALGLEIVFMVIVLSAFYSVSGGEPSEAGPAARAFGEVLNWVVEHLISPIMSVVAYCYLLMLYYSTTKTDMAIISIRMDNPRFRHYTICIIVLTMLASLVDLTALVSTLGVFGAYRRYIFETPPKKRVKQAVTKLAEAL